MLQSFGTDSHSMLYKWFILGQSQDACYKALGQIPTACCINGSFGVSHRMHVTKLWDRFPQHAV